MKWAFLRDAREARQTVTGTGAIKKGFVQLKGARFLLQGPWFPLRGHRSPLPALGSPYKGPF